MNMSFMLTTQQMEDGTKDVTRRLGWRTARAGQVVQPMRKCQGLRKGQHPEPVGPPIRFTEVRAERLDRMLTEPAYGAEECRREGFPHLTPLQFVTMFCVHNGCRQSDHVVRIAFERVQEER